LLGEIVEQVLVSLRSYVMSKIVCLAALGYFVSLALGFNFGISSVAGAGLAIGLCIVISIIGFKNV